MGPTSISRALLAGCAEVSVGSTKGCSALCHVLYMGICDVALGTTSSGVAQAQMARLLCGEGEGAGGWRAEACTIVGLAETRSACREELKREVSAHVRCVCW